jgi:glycosyltransferase involved in cell wall biosynthesis
VSRLRILFLIDSVSEYGGAERFTVGLATHLPRDRFEVWICSTRIGEPTTVAALNRAGVMHISCGRRAKWDVHRLRTLVALLRRQRFDVVHSHKFGSNVWGTIFARACHVPVVIAHEHNWSYSGNPLRIWIDRLVIARLADRFIAVSQANRERMLTIERIPADKIVVLPTAYIPHAVTTDTDIRSELGLAREVRVITTAAVLRAEKALEVLIEAHAQVARRISQTHLVICGEGPCLGDLEQRVAELGTGELVHFLGRRDDVGSILRASDVCALSSDWEGMPLFVFECMAAGAALVATNVGGVPEVVEDGSTGLLVPPRDPAALADALVSLLTDPAYRHQLASAAARRIDEFTIESVAARFASLYEELMQEARHMGLAPAVAVGP